MQCRRCDFQNIPNAARCVRCGAALAVLDDVAVTPPRSVPSSLGIRMGYTTRRLSHKISKPFRSLASRVFEPRHARPADDDAPDNPSPFRFFSSLASMRRSPATADAAVAEPSSLSLHPSPAPPPQPQPASPVLSTVSPSFPFSPILLSVIPGLWQFIDHRKVAGVVMFSLWITALVMSMGSPWVLGIAVSIHVHAIVDALRLGRRLPVVWNVLITLLVFVFLWYVAYDAAIRAASRYFYRMSVPVSVLYPQRRTRDSLVLLWTRHSRVAPYDIVQYNRRTFRPPGGVDGDRAVYVAAPAGLDLATVIALSGDTVSFVDGRMQVNGADIHPPRSVSGVPQGWPRTLNGVTIHVAPGQVVLVPAAGVRFNLPYRMSDESVLRQFVLIQETDIVDRAVAVIRPLSEMQRL